MVNMLDKLKLNLGEYDSVKTKLNTKGNVTAKIENDVTLVADCAMLVPVENKNFYIV